MQLPEGEDMQEWIAVHGEHSYMLSSWDLIFVRWLIYAVVDFFNHVNMLYGTISEFCTPSEVSRAVSEAVRADVANLVSNHECRTKVSCSRH